MTFTIDEYQNIDQNDAPEKLNVNGFFLETTELQHIGSGERKGAMKQRMRGHVCSCSSIQSSAVYTEQEP